MPTRINPFFYVFVFFNSTVFLPVVVTGLRVYELWYSPLSDSGQVTFSAPFTAFAVAYLIVSVAVGYLVFRLKRGRFILVSGPLRVRSVLRAILKDSFGRAMIIAYLATYFVSYLIVSGLWLVPDLNVSSYFLTPTVIAYEGNGIEVVPLMGTYLVLNSWLLLLGVVNDVVLSVALSLGYYILSLIYVSLNAFEWKVPGSFRLAALNTAGGFLTASVPSIGTIAGICCLTPTAMNSLLFLISSSYPAVTKGVMWKYGTFVLGSWTGGLLQALVLASPVVAGLVMIGVAAFEVYKISNAIASRVRL